MAHPVSFLLVVIICVVLKLPPHPLHIVLKLSLFVMPTKVDGRNEVGAIIHTVANRVLSNHTAKNIFGNVNYSKHFLQGTVVGVFGGHAPGEKNAVWKLMVNFEMPSDNPGAEIKTAAAVATTVAA